MICGPATSKGRIARTCRGSSEGSSNGSTPAPGTKGTPTASWRWRCRGWNEELSAHRVAIDARPGATTGRIHLIEAGPRELQDGRAVVHGDAVVDRRADRDQLHLPQALAVEADVSGRDEVE